MPIGTDPLDVLLNLRSGSQQDPSIVPAEADPLDALLNLRQPQQVAAPVAQDPVKVEAIARQAWIEQRPSLAIGGIMPGPEHEDPFVRDPAGNIQIDASTNTPVRKPPQEIQLTPAERLYAASLWQKQQAANRFTGAQGAKYIVGRAGPAAIPATALSIKEEWDAGQRIVQDMEKGTNTASDRDYLVVGQLMAEQAEEAPTGAGGVVRGAVDIATAMPGMALDYLTTGGAAAGGQAATRKLLTKLIGQKLAATTAGRVGIAAASVAGGEASRLATPQMFAHAAEGAADRMRDKVGVKSTGTGVELDVKQGEGIVPALGKALALQYAEQLGERTGEGMLQAAGAARGYLLKNAAKGGALEKFLMSPPKGVQPGNVFNHIRQAMHYDGLAPEFAEELITEAMQSAVEPQGGVLSSLAQGDVPAAVQKSGSMLMGFAAMPMAGKATALGGELAREAGESNRVAAEELRREQAADQENTRRQALSDLSQPIPAKQTPSQWDNQDLVQGLATLAPDAVEEFAASAQPSRSALASSGLEAVLKDEGLYDQASNATGRQNLWNALRARGRQQGPQMDQSASVDAMQIPQQDRPSAVSFPNGRPAFTWPTDIGDVQIQQKPQGDGWTLITPRQAEGQTVSKSFDTFEQALDAVRGVTPGMTNPAEVNRKNVELIQRHMERVRQARRSGKLAPLPTPEVKAAMEQQALQPPPEAKLQQETSIPVEIPAVESPAEETRLEQGTQVSPELVPPTVATETPLPKPKKGGRKKVEQAVPPPASGPALPSWDKPMFPVQPIETTEAVVDPITKELDQIESLKQKIKERAMVYQADLKEEVAKENGVPPETYFDLPYDEWEPIRTAYNNKLESRKELPHGQEVQAETQGEVVPQETLPVAAEPIPAATPVPSKGKPKFHGSAKKFPRFSTGHIGTGEGNAGWGWGLYFTDSEGVADFYEEQESTRRGTEGAKYEVELKPAEEEYLLWDETSDKQSEFVKKALEYVPFGPRETGGDLYARLVQQWEGDSAQASQDLKIRGIRGIKYLAGRSRESGDTDTYNYVVFDDRDVEIKKVVPGKGKPVVTELVEKAKPVKVGKRGQYAIPGMEEAATDAEAREARQASVMPAAEQIAEKSHAEPKAVARWLVAMEDAVDARLDAGSKAFDFEDVSSQEAVESLRPVTAKSGSYKTDRNREDAVDELGVNWFDDMAAKRTAERKEFAGWKVGDMVQSGRYVGSMWKPEDAPISAFEWDNGEVLAMVGVEHVQIEDLKKPEVVEEGDDDIYTGGTVDVADAKLKGKIDPQETLAAIQRGDPVAQSAVDQISLAVLRNSMNAEMQAVTDSFTELTKTLGREKSKLERSKSKTARAKIQDLEQQYGLAKTSAEEKRSAISSKYRPLIQGHREYQESSQFDRDKLEAKRSIPTVQPDSFAADQIRDYMPIMEGHVAKETAPNRKWGMASLTMEGLHFDARAALFKRLEEIAPDATQWAREHPKLVPLELVDLVNASRMEHVTPEPANPYGTNPWVDSDVADESKWFGTRVKVTPTRKYQDAYEGVVVRVLNKGQLVEVKPDGADTTFRVTNDTVEVLDLKTNKTAGDYKPTVPEKIFQVTNTGHVYIEQLNPKVADAVGSRMLERNKSSYSRSLDENTKEIVDRLNDMGKEAAVKDVDTDALDESYRAAEKAENEASSVMWNRKHKYEMLVNSLKSSAAAKLGVPNQSKAAKWAGKWKAAESMARDDQEAKRLKAEFDEAEAAHKAAKAKHDEVRRQRERETARKQFESLGEVPVGAVLISSRNPAIAIRVGKYDAATGDYAIEYGAHAYSTGEFYPSSNSKLPPQNIANNYVTIQQDTDVTEVIRQLEQAASEMKERKKEEAARKEKESRKDEIAAYHAKLLPPDFSQLTLTPARLTDGDTPTEDENVFTDGKILLLKNKLPTAVVTALEKRGTRSGTRYSEGTKLRKSSTDDVLSVVKPSESQAATLLAIEPESITYDKKGKKDRSPPIAIFEASDGTIRPFNAETVGYLFANDAVDRITVPTDDRLYAVLWKGPSKVGVIVGYENVAKDLDVPTVKARFASTPFTAKPPAPKKGKNQPKPKGESNRSSGEQIDESFARGPGNPPKAARTFASWANKAAETTAGKELLRKQQADIDSTGIPKAIGTGWMFKLITDAIGMQINYSKSQTTKKHPALYRLWGAMGWSRSPGDIGLNWHEIGHHVSMLLLDAAGKTPSKGGNKQNYNELLREATFAPVVGKQNADTLLLLTDTKTSPDGRSFASAKTAEEGFAELVRRYVEEYGTLDSAPFSALRDVFERKLEKHAPQVLGALKDSQRFLKKHFERPTEELIQVEQNERVPQTRKTLVQKSKGLARRGVANIVGPTVKADQDINDAKVAIAKRSGWKAAREWEAKLRAAATQEPINEREWFVRLSGVHSEVAHALNGGKHKNGVRLYVQKGLDLTEDEVELLKRHGVDMAWYKPGMKRGDALYLSADSINLALFNKLQDAGQEEDFSAYAVARAELFRYEKWGSPYPFMGDNTPDKMRAAIRRWESTNPEYVQHFKTLNQFMKQLLLVDLFTRDRGVQEIVDMIAAHQEIGADGKITDHYVPLPRNMEGDVSGRRGAGGSSDYSTGHYAAHGSTRSALPMREAVRRYTARSITAYYQQAALKSMIAFRKSLETDGTEADVALRKTLQRHLLPVTPDLSVVAELKAADLDRSRGPQWEEGAPPPMLPDGAPTDKLLQLIAQKLSEELGMEIDPHTIDISDFQGLPILRSKKPKLHNVWSVFDDERPGHRLFFYTDDPTTIKTLNYLAPGGDSFETFKKFAAVAAAANRSRRSTIVRTAGFLYRNMLRDPLYQMATAKPGDWGQAFIPFLNNYYYLRYVMGGKMPEAEHFAELMQRDLSEEPRGDESMANRFIDHVTEGFGPLYKRIRTPHLATTQGAFGWAADMAQAAGALANIAGTIETAPLAALGWGEWLETMPRAGAYARAKMRGGTDLEAANAFVESTGHFAQKPLAKSVAALFSMGMFVNPGVQANYGLWKDAFDSDPQVKAMFALRMTIALMQGTTMGGIAALSLGLLGGDDEDWKKRLWKRMDERPQGLKDSAGWFVSPLGPVHFPFGEGPMGLARSMGFNAAVETISEGEYSYEVSAQRMLTNIATQTPAGNWESIMPIAVRAGVEQTFNYDFFRERRIEDEKLQLAYPDNPELRYYPSDPAMYVWLADKVGVASPQRLKHLFESFGGDSLSNFYNMATGNEWKLPGGLGSLRPGEYEGWRAQSSKKVRDTNDRIEAMNSTINKLLKQGRPVAELEKELIDLGGAKMAHDDMQKLWEEIKDERERKSPRREYIIDRERRMTDIAREYAKHPEPFQNRYRAYIYKLRKAQTKAKGEDALEKRRRAWSTLGALSSPD